MFNWLEEGENKICYQCSKYPCFCYDNIGKCTKCYFNIDNCECKGEERELNWYGGICKKCKQGVFNCKCEKERNQLEISTSSNSKRSEIALEIKDNDIAYQDRKKYFPDIPLNKSNDAMIEKIVDMNSDNESCLRKINTNTSVNSQNNQNSNIEEVKFYPYYKPEYIEDFKKDDSFKNNQQSNFKQPNQTYNNNHQSNISYNNNQPNQTYNNNHQSNISYNNNQPNPLYNSHQPSPLYNNFNNHQPSPLYNNFNNYNNYQPYDNLYQTNDRFFQKNIPNKSLNKNFENPINVNRNNNSDYDNSFIDSGLGNEFNNMMKNQQMWMNGILNNHNILMSSYLCNRCGNDKRLCQC